MPDYFPLAAGAVREYSSEHSQAQGTFKTEVLSVATAGAATTAKCRRTVLWNGEPPKTADFEVVKDSAEVRSDAGTEFKLPLKKGTQWIVSPRRYWIDALDAVVMTPAGKFTGCLRVAYLIAEGDGGSGERYYAPGVGLVKVVENDESDPFTHELISHFG
jgi:hypothetical protein